MNTIFQEVEAELQYQANRWANGSVEELLKVDQERNNLMDFVGYISHYATKWFPGGFPPYNRATLVNFRKNMVQVMTLAFSAIRAVDARLATMPSDEN